MPLLTVLVEQLLTNKLSETSFPAAACCEEGASNNVLKTNAVANPRDHFLLVYIVGGATFEELAAMQKINEKREAAAVLGGPVILNSAMFVQYVDGFDGKQ